MYCSNCGSKLENDTKFCGYCGTPVNNNDNSNQQYQENNYHTQPQNNNYVKNQKNPWELFLDGWKHIFNYQGVTSRRGFWWFMLIQAGASFVLGLLAILISGQNSFLGQLVLTIVYLPIISAGSRRMRDANKSIWWAIVPFGLAWFFQPFMVGYYLSGVMQIVVTPLSIVFIVFACFETKDNSDRERIN